ncbi:MAG: DUF1800 domain-containing protein [Burkholderiales bacterium]
MAWTREDAAHLLRRAGYGGSLEAVDQSFNLGQTAAIDAIVEYERTVDPVWTNDNPFGLPNVLDEWDGVKNALLWQILNSRRPLQAKLLWFWHGHFTTPVSTGGNALFRTQMATWRTHANGSFAAFLSAVYKDGAMLRYLNGAGSDKEHPNENFAREVMELYTTGTGPYRETDVREAARALTGWDVTWPEEQVVFDPDRHDAGTKTILGQSGNFDGEGVMALLARRPETARRVCSKLYRFFVSERVNLIDVSRMVQTWNATGGNVKAILRTMFTLPSFWDPRNRGFVFKDSLDFVFGLVQRLKLTLDLDRMRAVGWGASQMGQDLFEPPNPAGYATGLRLTGASMLLQRTQVAWWLLYDWADDAAIRILNSGLTAPVAPDVLVTTVAARLGVPALTANTRSAILGWLGPQSIPRIDLPERTRGVGYLVAISPEYQVM